MIVDIFVALSDGHDTLPQHSPLLMHHVSRITRIRDAIIDRVEQSKPLIDLLKQQRTRIAGEPTSIKIGDHFSPPKATQVQYVRVTLCHASQRG